MDVDVLLTMNQHDLCVIVGDNTICVGLSVWCIRIPVAV